MTITQASTALGSALSTIQLDGEALFYDVQAQPADSIDDFAGFPSCSYFYDNTDSDYVTVSQNRRVIEFGVYIYVLSQKTLAQQYALMYKIVDAVVNAIDQSDDLGINDAFVRPAPADFSRLDTERGNGLLANVRVFFTTDIAI